jgi:hypothetical protein
MNDFSPARAIDKQRPGRIELATANCTRRIDAYQELQFERCAMWTDATMPRRHNVDTDAATIMRGPRNC